MKEITVSFRKILRAVFILLGIVAAPYTIHAAYGMPDRGARIPIHGAVRSLETDAPVTGVKVWATGPDMPISMYNIAVTDDEGKFYFHVLEREIYDIHFADTDGELNGGFFRYKTRAVALSDIDNPINVKMEGENDVTIRGTIRSEKNNQTIAGIRLYVAILGVPHNAALPELNYQTQADASGNFSVRVPERESYSLLFTDAENELFRPKTAKITLSTVNDPLNIVLEEENIITIRGIVRSEKTGKRIAGIMAEIINSAHQRPEDRLYSNHRSLTNRRGFFEIRIPERERYCLLLYPYEQSRFSTIDITITRSAAAEVLAFRLQEF